MTIALLELKVKVNPKPNPNLRPNPNPNFTIQGQRSVSSKDRVETDRKMEGLR